MALRNFPANTRRHETREKRNAGTFPLLLDDAGVAAELAGLASEGVTPDEAFDRAWVFHRLRGRHRETLWQAIASTLEREEDYEDELAYLFRIMGRKG